MGSDRQVEALGRKAPLSIQGCMVNHADIPLTKHCSVTFKIGGYENEIGMTREALLYDRKIQNEGEADTYDFRQRVDNHSCTGQTNSHPTKESREIIRLLHSHYVKVLKGKQGTGGDACTITKAVRN